jgi:hypothetical protein
MQFGSSAMQSPDHNIGYELEQDLRFCRTKGWGAVVLGRYTRYLCQVYSLRVAAVEECDDRHQGLPQA